MEQKLAGIDTGIIRRLMETKAISEKELSEELNIPTSTVHRSINKLKELNIVHVEKRARFNHITINRHKKAELTNLLALLKKWDCQLNNQDVSILRIHAYEIHTNGRINSKQNETKYYPKNRVCIKIKTKYGTVNLDVKGGATQMMIDPFHLIVENDVSEKRLELLINREITTRYFRIEEELNAREIVLTNLYEITDGHIAVMDDWVANLAIKNHYKLKDVIDESIGVPEYEATGPEAIKIIMRVIEERKNGKE